MDIYERVYEYLNRPGLFVTAQILDGYRESYKDLSFMEILDHLLEQETENMKSRKVEMRLEYSKMPFRETIERLDFSFHHSVDRKVMDDLMTM